MRSLRRGHPYWPSAGPPLHLHEAGLGTLPITLLSAFAVANVANAIGLMTGISFLFGLLIALALYGFKLHYQLRPLWLYEDPRERAGDPTPVLAILLGILVAHGLYGFGAAGIERSLLDFFRATYAKDTYAIACWLIAGSLETIIFILARRTQIEVEY